MHKHVFLCVMLWVCIVVCCHAQPGVSSIGVLPLLDSSAVGNLDSVGVRRVAASITCSPSCTVLPVIGLHLDGKRNTPLQVELKWYTLSETNTKGFFAERSYNAKDLLPASVLVSARGRNMAKTTYALSDTNSYYGTSFYRIREEDISGSVTFSNTVAVPGYE